MTTPCIICVAITGSLPRKTMNPAVPISVSEQIESTHAAFESGAIGGTPYVQFVMGVKNAMPADRRVFDFYVETVNHLFPGAPWCAAGIGREQSTLNDWAIAAGGHARTGLEDNIRLDRNTLAPSNAALVRKTADICANYDRPVATPSQARSILGLRPV
jgi:3-keto-5-aminohexanoate cleavage enzyme